MVNLKKKSHHHSQGKKTSSYNGIKIFDDLIFSKFGLYKFFSVQNHLCLCWSEIWNLVLVNLRLPKFFRSQNLMWAYGQLNFWKKTFWKIRLSEFSVVRILIYIHEELNFWKPYFFKFKVIWHSVVNFFVIVDSDQILDDLIFCKFEIIQIFHIKILI